MSKKCLPLLDGMCNISLFSLRSTTQNTNIIWKMWQLRMNALQLEAAQRRVSRSPL